jgi:hypothetical protein
MIWHRFQEWVADIGYSRAYGSFDYDDEALSMDNDRLLFEFGRSRVEACKPLVEFLYTKEFLASKRSKRRRQLISFFSLEDGKNLAFIAGLKP